MEHPYRHAQRSIAELKAAILSVLKEGPEEGLRNVEIGRALGIYEGHEGHISRTLLAMMEREGVVEQDEDTSRWSLKDHVPDS